MGNAVSMNPNTFVSAGLADDFDGEILEVRFVPWDYNGSIQNEVLAARVTIRPDEESGYDEFTQHYSAGSLEFFAPSNDGDNSVDMESDDPEEREGPFLAKVGRRDSLSRSSLWPQFLNALMEAGYPAENLDDGNVSTLEGVRAHFNRIPQPKRGGPQQNASADDRPKEILVVTEVLEVPGASKSKGRGAAKSSGKSSGKSTAAASNGALDERLTEVVLEALAEEETLSKAQLPQFVIKQFDGKEKTAAVKRVTSVDFLAGVDAWTWDADEGTISIG